MHIFPCLQIYLHTAQARDTTAIMVQAAGQEPGGRCAIAADALPGQDTSLLRRYHRHVVLIACGVGALNAEMRVKQVLLHNEKSNAIAQPNSPPFPPPPSPPPA